MSGTAIQARLGMDASVDGSEDLDQADGIRVDEETDVGHEYMETSGSGRVCGKVTQKVGVHLAPSGFRAQGREHGVQHPVLGRAHCSSRRKKSANAWW
jgi:hypothetical protein